MHPRAYITALLLALALLVRAPSSDAQPELPCDRTESAESFYRAYLREQLQTLGMATNELLALAGTMELDNPGWSAHLRGVLPRWQHPALDVPDAPPAYAELGAAYGRMADALDRAARAYDAYLDDPHPEREGELAELLDGAVSAMRDFRPWYALLWNCPELGTGRSVVLLVRPT